MRTRIIAMSMLLAAVIVAGCEPLPGFGGGKVRFTASSTAVMTKTAYATGEGAISGGYQRINWTEGDMLMVYSPELLTPVSETQAQQGVTGKHYAKYLINAESVTPNGRYSNAQITNVDGNGLVWGDKDNATFYAIYPQDMCHQETSGGTTTAIMYQYDMSFLSSQSLTWAEGSREGLPAMNKAYMVATEKEVPNTEDGVALHFYPAFTAFEVHLSCADDVSDQLTLRSATLTSGATGEAGYMAGGCVYDIENLTNGIGTLVTERYTNPTNYVTVDLNDMVISKTSSEVVFTFFAMPKDLSQLTLKLTFSRNGSTATEDHYLKLKKSSLVTTDNPEGWITFNACHKARFIGLAYNEAKKWHLTIQTDVNDWELIEKETSFTEQVGVKLPNPDFGEGLPVSGAIEDTWGPGNPDHPNKNHYKPNDVPATDPSYYEKYYQVRTLNMDVANAHFVLRFKPTAPIGGYWRLDREGVGEGSLDHFDARVYLGEGEYGESNDLSGQIMGTWVEIHIFPKNFNPEAGQSYAMILKSFFSTERTFDTYYSADSEFQDVHGDGRYSYWLFTLSSSN